MKIIVSIVIGVVVILAGFYLYSGDNTGDAGSAPVVEEAPAEPVTPAEPEPLN